MKKWRVYNAAFWRDVKTTWRVIDAEANDKNENAITLQVYGIALRGQQSEKVQRHIERWQLGRALLQWKYSTTWCCDSASWLCSKCQTRIWIKSPTAWQNKEKRWAVVLSSRFKKPIAWFCDYTTENNATLHATISVTSGVCRHTHGTVKMFDFFDAKGRCIKVKRCKFAKKWKATATKSCEDIFCYESDESWRKW